MHVENFHASTFVGNHGENAGGPLGWGPLSLSTPYTPYITWVFIGYIRLLGGVKQLGYHPKGTRIFPYEAMFKGEMGGAARVPPSWYLVFSW